MSKYCLINFKHLVKCIIFIIRCDILSHYNNTLQVSDIIQDLKLGFPTKNIIYDTPEQRLYS